MAFDGSITPNQSLAHLAYLGHHDASVRATEMVKQTPNIKHQRKSEKSDKDRKGRDKDKKEKRNHLEEGLIKAIEEAYGIEFDPEGEYCIRYNDATDEIELADMTHQEVLLSLSPEEFFMLTDDIKMGSGVMTDRTA